MTLFSTAFRPIYLLRKTLAAGLAGWILLGAGAAWAAPPGRAGRIAEVAGTAWLFDPDAKAWARVQRNQTIGQGDQLRTDIRSRVALRVGSSTVWLDEQSDVEILQMDDGGLALQLLAGDVALRLRTAQAAQETRIQTREGVITPELEGLFRVDQLDRGSRLGVLQGRAQFDSDPGAPVQRAWLREGEQAEFWWAESSRIERQALTRDKFSAWFIGRDQAEAGLATGGEPYVSPEMTGAEDLNQYGNWETAVEYGNVWIPTQVGPSWEPYRDGNWAWTRQWGWSWVDNAPWGFAPFHYGRWVQFRGRWAWAPGRFEPRPAYAPALVAWSGGSGVSVGITIGGVRRPPQTGWVPLTPRQNFVPVYPHTPQYVERLQWNRDVRGGDRDRNDRYDRNNARPAPMPTTTPAPARGDAGPQPYRPVQAPTVTIPAPANANPGDNGYRLGDRWNPTRRDERSNVQRNVQPVQVVPSQPVITVPQTTAPQVQTPQPVIQRDNRDYNRDYRANRNAQDLRNNQEDRGGERPQRPRETTQPSPTVQTQQVLPQLAAPAPAQRPAQQPPMAQPPSPQQAQQVKPADDEKFNGRRNKREAQDRDFR